MSAKVYEIVTAKILERLEQGVVPWRKPWDSGASLGECKNLMSGNSYKGINAFTTALAGYRSPYFLSYKQAQDIGANVKRGEKGLPIIYFRKLEIEDASGKEKEIPMLRFSSVFNADQCEGFSEKLLAMLYPEKSKGNSEIKPIDACEKIVEAMPQRPDIRHGEQRAYYSQFTDYVNMPARDSFTSSEEYYSTLFHELTHSTGHRSRLHRDTLTAVAGFGTHLYSKEELVAEMGAAFLCARVGIDQPTIENSAAYIQSWLRILKGDPKLVVQAAGRAQKAADFVLGVKADVQS